jgi:hypothetical protein
MSSELLTMSSYELRIQLTNELIKCIKPDISLPVSQLFINGHYHQSIKDAFHIFTHCCFQIRFYTIYINYIISSRVVSSLHIFRQKFCTRFYALSQNCETQLLSAPCLPACLSVCLSIRLSAWNNSAPIGRIFIQFGISVRFRKSVEKIQVY